MNRALIIVDVQNDFVEGGALGCEGGAAVAAAINVHLRDNYYGLVVASRDWHDADNTNGGHFDEWPVHCVAGTYGADYHSALHTVDIDVHIKKGQGKPGYSAFEGTADDGDSLDTVLSRHRIEEVVVVGIATDYCVKLTAFDAKSLGYRVQVIDRLTAAVSPEGRKNARFVLRELGVEVV